MIRKIGNRDSVILLQNAFPTIEKYIDHPHIENNNKMKVSYAIRKEVLQNFNALMALKKQGIELFFPDIDKIRQLMLDELNSLD